MVFNVCEILNLYLGGAMDALGNTIAGLILQKKFIKIIVVAEVKFLLQPDP